MPTADDANRRQLDLALQTTASNGTHPSSPARWVMTTRRGRRVMADSGDLVCRWLGTERARTQLRTLPEGIKDAVSQGLAPNLLLKKAVAGRRQARK